MATPEPLNKGEGDVSISVQLGFARLRDGWHLAARHMRVKATPGSYGDDYTPRLEREPYPLAQASRQERIAALHVLPKLVTELQTAATNAIATIEEAKKLICANGQALGGFTPPFWFPRS